MSIAFLKYFIFLFTNTCSIQTLVRQTLVRSVHTFDEHLFGCNKANACSQYQTRQEPPCCDDPPLRPEYTKWSFKRNLSKVASEGKIDPAEAKFARADTLRRRTVTRSERVLTSLAHRVDLYICIDTPPCQDVSVS